MRQDAGMTASAPSGARYGVTSMVAPLKRVLVRRPATAGDWDAAGWRTPDPAALTAQHEAFVTLLGDLGAEVELAGALDGLVDAVYMHDPLIMTARGGIPLNMAKPIRSKEPGHAAEELRRLKIPVVGTLEGDAYADGGDRFWLDDHTIALGLGYRTNRAGADRLRELLTPEGVHVETYDMPHDQGPDYVLHLQSFLSAVTDELYVIYEPLAPVRLLQDIRERGIAWIAIDHDSYAAMGCNILAVRPGVVVMVEGNPVTQRALLDRGCEVHTFPGAEVCINGSGGPTCITRPILRG
jgi:N-dimethylarginine dimethylaminohydrolase